MAIRVNKTFGGVGFRKADIAPGGPPKNTLIGKGGIPVPKVSSPPKTTKYQHGSFPPGLVC